MVCSTYIQAVGDDDPVDFTHSAVLGLLRSAGREMPWLSCRHVGLPGTDPLADAGRIEAEAQALDKEPEIAYREAGRLVSRLERVVVTPKRPLPFKRAGIYLMSGGLGGIGRRIARFLLTTWQARLTLVGRTRLPDHPCVNPAAATVAPADGGAKPLAALEELSALGGDILYVAADICDPSQMRQVMDLIARRWQAEPDGFLHLAGEFHSRSIAEETADSISAGLSAKMRGSMVLNGLAKPGALFVNVGSVNGFLGGAMSGVYSAANSFLAAFSQYQRRICGLDAVCLSFSMWDEVGMSQGYLLKEQSRRQGYFQIDAGRGLTSLLAGLAAGHPQLLIGLDGERPNVRRHVAGEFQFLVRLRAYTVGDDGDDALPAVADRYGTACPCERVPVQQLPGAAAGAEPLTGASATTDLERRIADIWKDVLGVPQVAVDRSFFDLGGNSLALVQIHVRLRQLLNREVRVVDLLHYPTVRSLAGYLGEAAARPSSYEDARQRAKMRNAAQRRRSRD